MLIGNLIHIPVHLQPCEQVKNAVSTLKQRLRLDFNFLSEFFFLLRLKLAPHVTGWRLSEFASLGVLA